MHTYRRTKAECQEVSIVSVTCNVCGRVESYDESYMTTDWIFIRHTFGYAAGGLDMSSFEADICHRCLLDWSKTFKLPTINVEPTFTEDSVNVRLDEKATLDEAREAYVQSPNEMAPVERALCEEIERLRVLLTDKE